MHRLLLLALGACTTSHEMTVTIRGAGSVVGRVESSPAGIDCELQSQPGAVEVSCTAGFESGLVALTFLPDGAGQVARFTSPGLDPVVGDRFELEISGDTTVDVFPISIPPP